MLGEDKKFQRECAFAWHRMYDTWLIILLITKSLECEKCPFVSMDFSFVYSVCYFYAKKKKNDHIIQMLKECFEELQRLNGSWLRTLKCWRNAHRKTLSRAEPLTSRSCNYQDEQVHELFTSTSDAWFFRSAGPPRSSKWFVMKPCRVWPALPCPARPRYSSISFPTLWHKESLSAASRSQGRIFKALAPSRSGCESMHVNALWKLPS